MVNPFKPSRPIAIPVTVTAALSIAAVVIAGFLLGWLASWQPVAVVLLAVALLGLLVAAFILYKPARVLFVFLALLPIYQLTLVVVLHFSGSLALVNALQPWKEALALAALLLAVLWYTASGRLFRPHFLDLLVLLYLGLNLLYLLGPWQTNLTTRLYGMRTDAFMVILYLLGRSLPMPVFRQKQLIIGLLLLGVGTAVFTVADLFILPGDWPVRLGLPDYLAAISGESILRDPTYIGPLGLPWTYWTAEGLRRASAFYANPLDLAASVHITGVIALIVGLYYGRKTRRGLFAWIVFALVSAALLLSISRASILAFALECLLVAWFTRQRSLLVLILLAICAGAALVLIASPTLAQFVISTLTFQNPSSQGHLTDWVNGFNAILQNPLGLGPGSSGIVGARFGNKIGGENQFIILSVELGLPGLLMYLFIQWIGIGAAFRLFRRTTGPTNQLALLTGVSRLGLLLVGMTAHFEIYVFPAFISWWLLGFVQQALATHRLGVAISDHAQPSPILYHD